MRGFQWVGSVLALAAAPLLPSSAVWGGPAPPVVQATVEGVVEDPALGEPVEAARVRLLVDDEEAARTRTDPDGAFRFTDVEAGEHHLEVEASGYLEWSGEVEVPERGTVRLEVHLARSYFQVEVLRVPGRPLEVRRETTEFGTRVDARALERMPVPYEAAGVVEFVPGGTAEQMWGGADGHANLHQVDGVPLTHPGTGGPLLDLSPAWTESVEVRGLGAGAEEGHFQGAVVDVATRSGGPEREGRILSRVEAHPLNATNVVEGEVGRERARRVELEGDGSGPLIEDRLFYFAGARALEEEVRALSRMPNVEERFLPHREARREVRGFGKLTWTPGSRDRIDLTGAVTRAAVDRWGLDGHQAPEATGRLEEPARFASASWLRGRRGEDFVRVQAAYAGGAERFEPDAGRDVPATRFYTLGDPPSPTFHNAEFALDRKPVSRTVGAHLGRRFATGPLEHRVRLGGELTRSRWRDVQRRTGGLTWRPSRRQDFDPDAPETWGTGSGVTAVFGGEVDLHARMASDAAYVQHRVTVGDRLTVTPGVRWGRWQGDLLTVDPEEGDAPAVEDDAWDPRVGAILEVPGVRDLLLKGHWGRYHQPLMAPFFDRAAGADVFTDQERWYYSGPTLEDPATTFTEGERDELAQRGDFEFMDRLPLNQTGPVAADYRQPHVDQRLLGVEVGLGARVRVEALWMDRTNQDMVGLRDRNLQDNYRRFENIRVRGVGEGPYLERDDGPITIPAIYVPEDHLRDMLLWAADPETGEGAPEPPPGMSLADTVGLSYEEDLVLGNLPEAERRTRQLHLVLRAMGRRWGAVASLVHTRVVGNLHSVTGYQAGTDHRSAWDLGPGPWAWPHEGVNAHGRLPGHSPLELKLFLHGDLPWNLAGGAFLRAERGERFTPYFQVDWANFEYESEDGEELDSRYLIPVSGQRVFVDPRGAARYPDRFTLDLRIEREIPLPGGEWSLRADLLNAWNASDPVRINPALNFPTRVGLSGSGRFPRVVPDAEVFGAVWQRIPPRTLRLGLSGRF